jgi:hypothetical protein
VTRNLTNSDVRQQTDNEDRPATYKDGKPKFVLVIQVSVVQSDSGAHVQIFENGEGSLWLKGITSDALKTAMAAAGIPNPDATLKSGKIGGALVTMISAGEKQPNNPKYSATKLFNFNYVPGGEESSGPTASQPAPAPAAALPSAPTPAPAQPPAPAGYAPPAPPQFAAPQPPPSGPMYNNQPGTPPVAYAQPTPPPPGPGGTLPDPALAYTQATGQPMPAPGTGPGGHQYILPDGTPIDAEKLALLQKLNGGQG